MAGKYINILLAGLLTILLLACSDDRDSLSGQASGDPLLTFNMTRAGGDIVGNTLVYLFDGQGSDAGKFNHKVQEVTYGPGSTFDDCRCRDVEYSSCDCQYRF